MIFNILIIDFDLVLIGEVDMIFINATKTFPNGEKSKSIRLRPYSYRANENFTGLMSTYPSDSTFLHNQAILASNLSGGGVGISEKFATISGSTMITPKQFIIAIEQFAIRCYGKVVEKELGTSIDCLPPRQQQSAARLAVEKLLQQNIIPVSEKLGKFAFMLLETYQLRILWQ